MRSPTTRRLARLDSLLWAGLALAAAAGASCSAPALNADLAAAEAHEKAGDVQPALDAYRRAQTSCQQIRDLSRRTETCSAAHLRAAELLANEGHKRQAIFAFEEAIKALSGHAPTAARAHYRIGQLYLDLGDDVEAYAQLWKTITDYPAEAFAADAVKLLLFDGRARNAEQLRDAFSELARRLADTDVADNLWFALADLAEHEFEDPGSALAYYDLIAQRYPKGGFFDESCWHGARLARLAGDGRGAERRLRTLLATREVSWGPGSPLSVWLDNAQLELGRVLRDDLGQYPAAVDAFDTLHEHYPASVLRDDALWETALTWERAGDAARACKVLSELKDKHPDSKYELEKAPALRKRLACASKV